MSIAGFHPLSRSGMAILLALLVSLLLHLLLFMSPQIQLMLSPAEDSKGFDKALESRLNVVLSAAESTPAPKPPVQAAGVSPAATHGPSITVSGPVKKKAKKVTKHPAVKRAESKAAVAESKPLKRAEAPPAKTEAAKPAKAEEPKPVKPEENTQAKAEESPPVKPEENKQVKSEEPQPAKPDETKQAKVEDAKPLKTEAAAPAPHPPLKVVIEFALIKGDDGLTVGRAMHTWEISDGHYVLTNVMEATGIFALFKPGQLVQSSQGRISANSLQPDSYWDQRGQEADKTFNAEFNYQNKTLTFTGGDGLTTVPLPPGTQDQLSFVYQFALRAPFTGTVQFPMTNGRKLDNYSYQVIGEEKIKTGMGKLRTLHISKVRNPNDDGVDIWLAADHLYLPVKVRLTDSDGGVAEQVVKAIREGK